MASPEGSFVEMHQDFVLKLKVVGEGDGYQIRRVRLPRIVKDGEVSFEELVGLLISFVLDPENPTQNLEVKVTYVDNENDTIVVSSSEELMDAIDQSDDPKLLRLTAEVKRCAAKKGGSTAKPVPPPSNRASPEPTKTTTPTNNSSTNNAGTQAGPAPVLQHVVESVVDIILRAAVAVNGHGISSSPNNSHPFYSPDGTPTNTNNATAAAASSMEAPAPFAEHNQDQTSVAERTDVLPEAPIPAPDAAATEDVQPQPRVPEEKAAAKQENPKEEEKEELRPFIHGRHTCDSCLTTPIVGKRYHATNLPDYDLCEKCHDNYKGKEMTFESVELDRDRRLQERWHRRRHRINGGGGRRPFAPGHHQRWGPGGPGNRGCRGRPIPPPPPGPPVGPRGRPLPTGPPPVGGPAVCPMRPPFPPPPKPASRNPPPVNNKEEDLAMNEAIRRSLQDLMISNKEAKDDKAQKKPSEDVDVETDAEENVVVANDKPEPSAPVEDNETGGATPVVETVTEEEEKEIEVAKSETKPSADDNASQASLTKEPGYNLFAREQRLKIREEHSEFTFVQITEEQRSRWKALSDEEKAEYKNLSTVIPMPSSPVAAAVEVPLPTSPSFASGVSVVKGDEKEDLEDEKEKVRESSFSTDAAGNGDVADLLGSTLDRCAEAIDAMVSELERTASNDESDGDSYDSSYVGVTEEGEEQDAETTENGEDEDTNGATILESTSSPGEEQKEEESQTKEERSEDGWQVVSDDNHINGDEELARAAQMVGSALFNSDMKSSGEVLSTLTGSAAGSDAFSQASSVPTSVPSLNYVSAAQLQRWAPQLTQLHEMGFDDDALCVEILERLSAANIGVGDDEEISVQQVVNQLWKS